MMHSHQFKYKFRGLDNGQNIKHGFRQGREADQENFYRTWEDRYVIHEQEKES